MADLSLIKKLRETTGCGIADCNKALAENKDDFEILGDSGSDDDIERA
jgi:translation elongation factor EF-Ts